MSGKLNAPLDGHLQLTTGRQILQSVFRKRARLWPVVIFATSALVLVLLRTANYHTDSLSYIAAVESGAMSPHRNHILYPYGAYPSFYCLSLFSCLIGRGRSIGVGWACCS